MRICERRPDVVERVVPPLLRIARRAAVRRPHQRVGLGVAGVHRELDEVDAGLDEPLELLAVAPAAVRTCCRWCSSRSARPSPWRTRSCSTMCGWSIGSPPPVQRIQAPYGPHSSAILFHSGTGNRSPSRCVIELADLGVAVGVRTVRAAEVARIDDREDDHQRKLLRARPQPVRARAWSGVIRHTCLVPVLASKPFDDLPNHIHDIVGISIGHLGIQRQ